MEESFAPTDTPDNDYFWSLDSPFTSGFGETTTGNYVTNVTYDNEYDQMQPNATGVDATGDTSASLPQLVAVVSILMAIALCAIVGNVLVIASVATDRRLRTITNRFVVSLATADLTVATLVLPPAVKMEFTGGRWLLGRALCDVWISFDVMLCTASILNLCCISLDRYLAVTRPLQSATGWRSKRLANVMIAVVWIASFVVTCPPLLGWREAGRDRLLAGDGEGGAEKCMLTRDPGYVVYSALGSFYVPLAVMLFVYANIFKVVRSRQLQTGTGSSCKSNCADAETSDSGLHRRAHGTACRPGCQNQHKNTCSMKMVELNQENRNPRQNSDESTPDMTGSRAHFVRSGVTGNRGDATAATEVGRRGTPNYLHRIFNMRTNRSKSSTSAANARPSTSPFCDDVFPAEVGEPAANAQASSAAAVDYEMMTSSDRYPDRIEQLTDNTSFICRCRNDGGSQVATRNGGSSSPQSAASDAETIQHYHAQPSNCNRRIGTSGSGRCCSSYSSDASGQQQTPPPVGSNRRHPPVENPHQAAPTAADSHAAVGRRPQTSPSGAARLLHASGSGSCERSAVRREGKTAKTLSIVVGGFVFCWLPFFILYIVEPFCTSCPPVSPHLRSFCTWLGYANSVVNPFIYAYYNPFFRQSFWRLTFGFCCGGGGGTGNGAKGSSGRRCCRHQRRLTEEDSEGGKPYSGCCSGCRPQCLRFRLRGADVRTTASADCGRNTAGCAACGGRRAAGTLVVVDHADQRNSFNCRALHQTGNWFRPEVGAAV